MSTNNPNNPFSREGAESLAHTVRQAQRAMEEHPLSAVHINQGSADAMADAYDAEYQASPTMTTPPNAPEADALATIEDAAICLENWGEIHEARDLRAAVAALLTREAALVARNAELERLCDSTYVEQGADAYHHACEVMEAWQKARRAAGKDPGCEGSLCDGLSWLQTRITKTEDERDALAAEVGALRLDAERWQTIRDSRSSITLSLHCTAPSERERFIDALRAEAGQG